MRGGMNAKRKADTAYISSVRFTHSDPQQFVLT